MMHYFAYGSNLHQSQMYERCPDSKLVIPGCLKEYGLRFNRFSLRWSGGVADVIRSEGEEVWGLVYTITATDLDRLDGFEGYPHDYDRFEATIDTPTGSISPVWTYTVTEKSKFTPPSQKYVGIIKRAAREHGFPQAYQDFMEKVRSK